MDRPAPRRFPKNPRVILDDETFARLTAMAAIGCSRTEVCAALNIPGSTLEVRLRERGTNYSELRARHLAPIEIRAALGALIMENRA